MNKINNKIVHQAKREHKKAQIMIVIIMFVSFNNLTVFHCALNKNQKDLSN